MADDNEQTRIDSVTWCLVSVLVIIDSSRLQRVVEHEMTCQMTDEDQRQMALTGYKVFIQKCNSSLAMI